MIENNLLMKCVIIIKFLIYIIKNLNCYDKKLIRTCTKIIYCLW